MNKAVGLLRYFKELLMKVTKVLNFPPVILSNILRNEADDTTVLGVL